MNLVFPRTLRRRRATDFTFRVPDHQETDRDNPVQAAGDRLHFPTRSQVPEHQEEVTRKEPQTNVRSQQARHRATDDISMVQVPGDGSHEVPEWLQSFEEGISGEPADSHNVMVEQPAVEAKEETLDDMRVSSRRRVNRSSFLSQKGPRDQTQASQRAGTFLNMFLNIRIVKFAKTTRAPFRNRPEARGDRIHPQNFGDAITADHRVLSQEDEICFCSIVTQLWCRNFILVGSELPNEKHHCARDDEQFANTHVGITTSQPHTDQKPMDLPKTQFAGSKKVPLRFWCSRLFKNSGGQMQWNASDNCGTCKTNCPTESHRMGVEIRNSI